MILDEKNRQKRHRNRMLGAFLVTTGIGIGLDALLNNLFVIFEPKTQVLATTLVSGILIIWILSGIWLLVWTYTSPHIWARPHIEGIKEFLVYTSKEIEEQIKKYTISKEDEKNLRKIIDTLNKYLAKEVEY